LKVLGANSMNADFLAGDGEMSALIRAYDWNSSPLGPPENWPQSLQVVVRLILTSPQPMLIWWGPELIQFYNDAHIPLMDPGRHPSALGGRGRDFCSIAWDIVAPQIDHVMTGKGSIWEEDRLIPVARGEGRENSWWSYSYAPIDVEGRVRGVLVICNDVTAQHLASQALRDQTLHLKQLFEQAPGFMAVLRGPNHVFELTNAAYAKLIGDRDFIGRPLREVIPEIEGQGRLELLDEVYRTGKPYVATRLSLSVQPASGRRLKEIFVDIVYQPIVEANGEVSGIFIAGVDVTDHVHAEQHLHLMNAELEHRVKNILAVVSAIGWQTLSGNSADDALEGFQSRLTALGRAHKILTVSSQPSASVRDVVENAIAPHKTGPGQTGKGRISVSGPHVILGSKQALALGLAIHELATNAIKYGALSNDRGRISLSWRKPLDRGAPVFKFSWVERDGPPVERPTRKGFGSGLIEGRLAWDFGGRVEVSYQPTGFICRLTAPMGNLGWPPPSPAP
jgi:two-component sensor histidine kinase